MNDTPIELDLRRGMAAQKETEERRTLSGVRADQAELELRQRAFEESLEANPARTQQEAAAKAIYLLKLYGATQEGQTPLRARLIARSVEELNRLSGLGPDPGPTIV